MEKSHHVSHVTITTKEVVAPLSNDHRQKPVIGRLPFSNLDYFYTDYHKVSIYFCYTKPKDSDVGDHHSLVCVLRDSLARTLSNFPVLAGEVVTNSVGEPESLLSDNGVDFFIATSGLELRDLDLFHPDESVRGSLVPAIQHGVLAVQVTEMKCGGLVLGVTFEHRVADAYSANMFLLSWSEVALRHQPSSYIPIFDRSLTRQSQRVSSVASSALDDWYAPLAREELTCLPDDVSNSPEVVENSDEQFTSRTFYVEGETIKGLQEKACLNNGCKEGFRTKYEAFTAFLWQLLAKSSTTTFKIAIPIDGRTRMHSESTQNASFMKNYFGNVLSYPIIEAPAKILNTMSLSDAADLIHRCKEATATPEHFSDVVDWVEERRPMFPLVRVCPEKEAVIVSSGQRFPVEKIEFGWGKAAFGSYYFPLREEVGYVMPMPSSARNGDWVVYMHLRKRHMELVENLGGNVFKPLTSRYLNLS